MRRLMLFLVMAPLVVLTVPATAQTPEELVTCPAPPAGTTVVGPSYSNMPVIASPTSMDSIGAPGIVDLKFQLDLSPATAANKASVGAVMDWRLRISDWDLALLDGQGGNIATIPANGEHFQPQAPPVEWLFQPKLGHCSLFTVRVINFQALGGPAADAVDPLRLEIETGIKR